MMHHGAVAFSGKESGRGRAKRLLLATAVLAAGCGGHGSDSSPPVDTTAGVATQDARAVAERNALLAYRGMLTAYARAGLTADPNGQLLARYAAGSALTTLQTGLAHFRRAGQIIRGEYRSEPVPTDARPLPSPTVVSIMDCLDDRDFLVYTDSGEKVNNIVGGRRLTTATVANRQGDEWKVITIAVQPADIC
ncbi:hypothetical protein [Phytohabitans rumicis]|nr:hypothetical protein [Phytohabitans rumicis]